MPRHDNRAWAAARQPGLGCCNPATTGVDLPGHDRLMRVRVVESGEKLDYRFTEILDDPKER